MVLGATLVLGFLAKHDEFPDIQINHVEEVTIPGVEGEYEFLFLTDMHLALKTREDLGPLGDADTRIAGFTNPKGTVSAKQLPQWISYANQEQVDAVLMGGDMLDYYSDTNAAYFKEQMNQLTMPYLFTLGNHDLFSPWEEAVPAESVLYDLFREGNSVFQILEGGQNSEKKELYFNICCCSVYNISQYWNSPDS